MKVGEEGGQVGRVGGLGGGRGGVEVGAEVLQQEVEVLDDHGGVKLQEQRVHPDGEWGAVDGVVRPARRRDEGAQRVAHL